MRRGNKHANSICFLLRPSRYRDVERLWRRRKPLPYDQRLIASTEPASRPSLHEGDQASRYVRGVGGQLNERKLEIPE